MTRRAPYDIAVVSMAGLYPGAADVEAFAGNVLAGRQFARPVPPGRWILPSDQVVCSLGQPDKAYCNRACFVEEFSLDPTGLNLDLAAVMQLDPVFQWVLHVGNQAWRRARTELLDRSRVGIALAAIALPTDGSSALTREVLGRQFEERLFRIVPRVEPGAAVRTHPLNAFPVGLPAGLLATGLGVGGGALTLDAACASSLYAIKIACDELAAGRVDAMLAGGVSRPEALYTQVGFSQLQALSRRGRCSPFDADADGLIVGEGCGILVLKRLEDALAHGDRVLGVIRAVGVSNDMAGSLLAADQEGQLRAMRAAYAQAGWRPDEVDHIECHGTGTPLGDATEFASLCELWSDIAARRGQCAIGSVKSMIGHTLTAAGVAGLQKTLIGLFHEMLPPSANFARPAERVPLDDSPFRVLSEARAWPRRSDKSPRRAAVSAFGFGGINAHLLVEEFVESTAPPRPPQKPSAPSGRVSVIGMHVVRATDGDSIQFPLNEFRIPPREIEQTLPQQLVMLNAVAEALRDSGAAERARGPRAGVIIGINLDLNTSNYHLRWVIANRVPQWAERLGLRMSPAELEQWTEALRDAASAGLNAPRVLGSLGSIVASRIAREFGLGGPSFAISAMENSGLRALEYATRAIQRGELDHAIVGAVDLCNDARAVAVRRALGLPEQCGEETAIALVLCREDLAVGRAYGSVAGIGFASGGPIAQASETRDPAQILKLAVARARRDAGLSADGIAGHALWPMGDASAVTGLARLVRVMCSADEKVCLLGACGQDGGAAAVVMELAAAHAEGAGNGRTHETKRSSAQSKVSVRTGPLDFDPPLPVPRESRPSRGVQVVPAAQHLVQPADATLMSLVASAGAQTAVAHQRFLRQSALALQNMAQASAALAAFGTVGHLPREGAPPEAAKKLGGITPTAKSRHQERAREEEQERRTTESASSGFARPAFTREQCLEFAIGSIAAVFGPRFAEVDAYPVRVRLPDEPLMLVDRVLHIEGEVGSLSRGRIVTEHEVRAGAWYLDCDRAPVCISVESGQADLMLSSYLGIDLAVKGKRAYRLLDATVQFHRGLPRPGETIRYDIRIDKFVRQGEAYLFFFRFNGSIDGQPLITMTDGCAGFFTPDEIERSGGIILPQPEQQVQGSAAGLGEAEPGIGEAKTTSEIYSEAELDALRRGDLAGCFGPALANFSLRDPVRLPGGHMRLIDRIRYLDLNGGRYGKGRVIAEADIAPDAWFLTCHFVDDMVMPGTLMYECCAHALRVMLTRMGWIGQQGEVAYEPVQGVPAKLKCRGPVTPATRQVTYQVDIKEIGYRPEPYVIADALMCADGRPIVQFTDMSMQLTGMTRQRLAEIGSSPNDGTQRQSAEGTQQARSASEARPCPTPTTCGVPSIGDANLPGGPRAGLFTKEQILAFSNGNPSECFGPTYRAFDHERRIARLPGPPYQVLDRITRIEGPRANVLVAGGWIEAQYDVPVDAWYFAENRQASMPFAILLEVALQPCGWLAAYVGSALKSAQDLRFRNLGGTATQHEEVFADAGTLTTRVRFTSVSEAAGMILENFEFEVWRQDGALVYAGDTLFGFFTDDALRQQVGIRDAAAWRNDAARDRRQAPGSRPAFCSDGRLARAARDLSDAANSPSWQDAANSPSWQDAADSPSGQSTPDCGLILPTGDWRMIDGVELYEREGGEHGLGLIAGWKDVDPEDWFFKAHFYQDPVIPGSLGLESLLELLKMVAIDRWGLSLAATYRFEPIALGVQHSWRYRGQIVPSNKRVLVQAQIKRWEEGDSPLLIADGYLSVDGLCIYEMSDFGIRLVRRNTMARNT